MPRHIWIPEGPRHDLNIEHHRAEDAGPFTGGGLKIVPHTTESPRESVDSMVNVLVNKRAAPHFVIGERRGFRFPIVVQMVALNRSARTLEHPPGTPETNRARAIQIEICGYTFGNRDAHDPRDRIPCHDWDLNWLKALANLFRMIHLNTGAPLRVTRSFQHPKRFTGTGWVRASTIAGHCHAPNQTHVDPTGLRAKLIATYALDGFQEIHPR